MRKKEYIIIIMLLISFIIFSGCKKQSKEAFKYNQPFVEIEDSIPIQSIPKEDLDEEENTKEKSKEKSKEKEYEITISFVGDVMVHRSQLVRAYNEEKSFDFTESFSKIDEYIIPHNYSIANLETTLSGKDEGIRLESSNYFKGYQGYPTFNSPDILAKNLKRAGFDMVTTANNHSLDGWTGGITNTLNVLDEVGLDHVGTYREQNDTRVLTKQINGINIAFFNYTYSTNGIIPPIGKEYMVNSLNNYDNDYINKMYDEIRSHIDSNNNIDLNIVYLHFGNEYHLEPNYIQLEICSELIKAGVDIIIGSHPHVLQPIDIIEVETSEGNTEKGLVVYSLGNFISSQKYTYQDPIPKDTGAILNLTFRKDIEGDVSVTRLGLIPTWVQWSKEFIRVIPVKNALLLYKSLNYYDLTEQDYKRLIEVNDFVIPHMFSKLNINPLNNGDEYYIDLESILN